MDTLHIILWVLIFINIASIVFNMTVGSRIDYSKLGKQRLTQGSELGKAATILALGIVMRKNEGKITGPFKDFVNEIENEANSIIKDSLESIYE